MEIVFSVPHLFTANQDSSENAEAMEIFMETLIALNLEHLRRHPTPPLYQSHVYYRRTIEWEPIPAVELRGWGDCKSLTAWLVAEKRLQGVPAKPFFRYHSRGDGFFDYHILVLTVGRDGRATFEDPSKVLGMKAQENEPAERLPLQSLMIRRSIHAKQGKR